MKFKSIEAAKNSFVRKVSHHWAILILVSLVGIISWLSFDSRTLIIGWDNFSVSLNPGLNAYRAIFSSWREYRGLGVVSDSEVVDVFRSVLVFLLSLINLSNISEQVLYLVCLATGVIGSFFLGKKVFTQIFTVTSKNSQQVAGLIAGVVYLANLHTLATFFLPISMYVWRFGALPLFIYCFILLLEAKHVQKRQLLLFVAATFFMAGSYLTATVFVTVLLILGMIAFSSYKNLRRYFQIFGLFVLLNSFWLLPFTVYTIQKSDLLPLASTFIEVNEIQLNQPIERFSWIRLITMVPSFFYTNFSVISTNKVLPIFSLANNSFLLFVLFLTAAFSFILSIIGAMLILRKSIKGKLGGIWIILLLVISLFLLRKEQPPLGFLYDWLGKTLPLSKIIFRFGGEKFYPLFAVSLSISASLSCGWLFSKLEPRKPHSFKVGIVLSLLILVMAPYFYLFRQGVFSRIVKTSIPPQYQEVATYLDQDKTFGRVLHLPFSRDSYWKTYSWGYVGSAFLNFMIERPLIDRTWEPASLENDYLHQSIQGLIVNFDELDPSQKARRVVELMSLLEKTDIKYVLFDESITNQVTAKGGAYFGDYDQAALKALLAELVNQKQFRTVYSSVLPAESQSALTLLQKDKEYAAVEAISSAIAIDPEMKNSYLVPLAKSGPQTTIQRLHNLKKFSRTFPFYQKEKTVSIDNKQVTLTQKYSHDTSLEVGIVNGDNQNQEVIFDIYSRYNTTNKSLEIRLQPQFLPEIGGDVGPAQIATQFNFEQINMLSADTTLTRVGNNTTSLLPSQYRLVINEQVFPIPMSRDSREKIGSVLLTSQSYWVSLLEKNLELPISSQDFFFTTNHNCFNDKKDGYQYSLDYDGRNLHLSSVLGTTCITAALEPKTTKTIWHWEPQISLKLQSAPATPASFITPNSWQAAAHSQLFGLSTYGGVGFCLLDPVSNACLNQHQFFVNQSDQSILIQPERAASTLSPQILITLPAYQEKQQLQISDVKMHGFTLITQKQVKIMAPITTTTTFTNSTSASELTLKLPVVSAPFTVIWQSGIDGLKSYQADCSQIAPFEKVNRGWASQYTTADIPLLAYQSKCPQGVYHQSILSPDTFGLWITKYSLFSGKLPQFSQSDIAVQEYLNRYHNLRTVVENKTLQQTANPFKGARVAEKINDILRHPVWQTTYTTINAKGLRHGNNTAIFAINQNSENQGIVGFESMDLVTLPSSWENLYIQNGDPNSEFSSFQVLSLQRVIPAWWNVSIKSQSNNQEHQVLLQFNQAYDEGWHLYYHANFVELLFGLKRVKAEAVKVDGWSMGWIIDQKELKGDEVALTIFHDQEKWTWMGWVITSTTILLSLVGYRASKSLWIKNRLIKALAPGTNFLQRRS